jgi:hypothetical protein
VTEICINSGAQVPSKYTKNVLPNLHE